ncbi:hypothetical protein N9J50_01850 [Methylophilaceae bacterium]|nr:hypothetical protein [Methylophilaceae bacterium]
MTKHKTNLQKYYEDKFEMSDKEKIAFNTLCVSRYHPEIDLMWDNFWKAHTFRKVEVA